MLLSGINISSRSPAANTTIPAAAVAPALCRSTKRAASGDIIIVARGHGVISRPVVIDVKPYELSSMNGRDTMASICAMNEHTEVMTLSVYMRIWNRSTGSIGAV